MRALHDLSVEVRSGSTRMDVLMDSMTALETAMTNMIDRIEALNTTTHELRNRMDKWNEQEDNSNEIEDEMYETLYANETEYHDMTTPRDAEPLQSTSLWADDSQARQLEAPVAVEEVSKMSPTGPVAQPPRNSVDTRREPSVQMGREVPARRIDQLPLGLGDLGCRGSSTSARSYSRRGAYKSSPSK